MDFIEKIYSAAKKTKKRILLPEGSEPRILKAVEAVLKKDLCIPVLMGDPDSISRIAKREEIDLKGAEIVDMRDCGDLEKYVALYCEIRKSKNIRDTEARKLITQNPVFYAALAISSGCFDGFVAGAATTTRDVAKAVIYCIGHKDDLPTVSGSIIIVLPNKNLGSNGVFLYADSGIVPDPTVEQLADIAIASAGTARLLLDDEPRVAMLSYSTKGSGGSGKSIEKVREATKLVNKRRPDIVVDGEIQIDCAVAPEVARRKDPNSRIKGKANVFIFPNLDAGNIAYKLTERFANANAIGPILQGLKRPASDLSRGCDWKDIVNAIAVVALIAQEDLK